MFIIFNSQFSIIMPAILTDDGSKTIYSNRFGEHYHSTYGAASESNHVFIEAGYLANTADRVSVFEVGFGTGLNAWLTLQQALKLNRHTRYETIELYPVDELTVSELHDNPIFRKLHNAPWGQPTEITSCFVLYKHFNDLLLAVFPQKFDVIYFDAFSPAVQPEMWSRDVFSKLCEAMNPGAVLTTYCAKGEVRRTMQNVGLTVERLPGYAGKREMLRAWKK